MRGLLIRTDQEPVIIDIQQDEYGSTLHALQKEVGGNIEAFPVLFGEGIALYVNEDGLATCPPNRAVYATKAMEKGLNLYPNEKTRCRLFAAHRVRWRTGGQRRPCVPRRAHAGT